MFLYPVCLQQHLDYYYYIEGDVTQLDIHVSLTCVSAATSAGVL